MKKGFVAMLCLLLCLVLAQATAETYTDLELAAYARAIAGAAEESDADIVLTLADGTIEIAGEDWAVTYLLTAGTQEGCDYALPETGAYYRIERVDVLELPERTVVKTMTREEFLTALEEAAAEEEDLVIAACEVVGAEYVGLALELDNAIAALGSEDEQGRERAKQLLSSTIMGLVGHESAAKVQRAIKMLDEGASNADVIEKIGEARCLL